MAVALSLKNLPKLPDGVGRPAYARADLSPGIVHFGIGNFHRAHLQVYLDRLMNAGRDHDWAIVGAGVTPYDVKMRDALAGQDWLSTVVEQSAEKSSAHVTGVMTDFLPPMDGAGDRAAAGAARDRHRLDDRHRGRLLHQPGDRRLRPGEPLDRRRRRASRGAEDGLRPDPRRPARPPRRRGAAVHRAVLRQRPAQRRRGEERGRRPRRGAGPEVRRLDPRQRRLPERHGRPHRHRHLRPRAQDHPRGVRHRGRLAGVLRGLHPVGGRGRVPRRPPRLRGGGRRSSSPTSRRSST